MSNLRIYNVPSDKSETELTDEFSRVGTFASIKFTPQSGYAIVSFDNRADFDTFAAKFPKLRQDLVVYRQL
jgi:hypothetical protein